MTARTKPPSRPPLTKSVLSCTCEALNDFVGDVGPQVNGKSEGGIGLLDQISQLFGTLQLVLLQPFLQKLFASLING